MIPGRAFAFSAFIALLVASLILSEVRPGTAADFAELPASAEETTPLRAGDYAPKFSARTVADEKFDFDPAALQRPAILISFRGGWCPYCNMHLSELRNAIPQIRALGMDVYFLSGDRPELLHASLSRETQDDIDGLDYVILSDANMEAALAFGTAFRVNQQTVDWLNEKGKDVDGSSIRQYQALAVPSVYVIDTSGEIAYDYVNADYKIRLSAKKLLEVAERVGKQ
ncbi:MAG: redoxin domain-containing protein [Gammaproteobacteria bacterium]|nr:redoxin domain-containing protein [Gammaproteobacteria bacterium]MDH4314016.1 redoxin domain-containing protein [Gammaproteobacteria bacterium]MDH5214928.1 redoxin domain-containing protein [Gammaproteobacteria bacterium]MDH5499761.1 redoxin domain-containing protein [Gammaproteobacteria bacterium]